MFLFPLLKFGVEETDTASPSILCFFLISIISLTPNIIKIPTRMQNIPIPMKIYSTVTFLFFEISKITVVPNIEETPPITLYYKKIRDLILNYIGVCKS